jgi:beta-lactamase regulating signal transducer with metallopeptidase domain/tetratricopeptide (TPR) repeat protein
VGGVSRAREDVPVAEKGYVQRDSAPHEDQKGSETMGGMKAIPSHVILAVVNIFGCLWLLGALIMLCRVGYGLIFLIGYGYGLAEVRDENLHQILNSVNKTFGGRLSTRIYSSPSLSAPVTMGFRTSRVILPSDLSGTLTDEELKIVLYHELAHIYHYDHLVGLLQRILTSLYWWTPFVYSLSAGFSVSREEVGDNYAIKGLKSPHQYARNLMNLARKTSLVSRLPMTAGMASPHISLEDRIKGILSKDDNEMHTRSNPYMVVLLLLVALFMAGCAVSIKISFLEDGMRDSVSREAYVQALADNLTEFYRIKSLPNEDWVPGDPEPYNDFLFKHRSLNAVVYAGRMRTVDLYSAPDCCTNWISGMREKYRWANFERLSQIETTVSRMPAYLAEYEYTRRTNERAKERVYFIVGNDYCFRIRLSSGVDSFDKVVDDFEEIVRSFEVVSFSERGAKEDTTPAGLNNVGIGRSPLPIYSTGLADTNLLMTGGTRSTAEEAELLEKKIEQNPDDVTSRSCLLGYYAGGISKDPFARTKGHIHLLWFIRNAPKDTALGTIYAKILSQTLDKEAYIKAKMMWLDHLKNEPEDLRLIENSANFFQRFDRELAEKSLKKGRDLDPMNPKWSEGLGDFYALDMKIGSKASRREAATKALEYYEMAYTRSPNRPSTANMLGVLAEAAWVADKPEKVEEYAKAMLKLDRFPLMREYFAHLGNIYLGRLALTLGDVEMAKEYLLKAGSVAYSDRLNNMGPDMTLAGELLERGEKEVVLKYFEMCSRFWEKGKPRLDQYASIVEKGGTPNGSRFRRNLLR